MKCPYCEASGNCIACGGPGRLGGDDNLWKGVFFMFDHNELTRDEAMRFTGLLVDAIDFAAHSKGDAKNEQS